MDRRTEEREAAAPGSDGDEAPREIELKLFVPASSAGRVWQHPLLAAGVAPVASELESRYFDTPDAALAARRMALRLRCDDGRWTQTLKLAAGDERALSVRSEWESVVDGPTLDLAALVGTPLATLDPKVLARLRPVFRTLFRRETREIAVDEALVEVAFDVGAVQAGNGKGVRSLPIHEVEFEVKRGAPPDLLRFAARLAKDLPLVPLADSKAARGHRLATRRPLEATRVELPAVRRDTSAPAHLACVLAAGNRALLANVHALIEIARDPAHDVGETVEFVHQARVALRRMRSAMHLFEPAVDDRRTRVLAKRLRSMGRIFGEARDQDVLATVALARLERLADDDEGGVRAIADLRAVSAAHRVRAHGALMRYLDTGDFGATTIAVERAVVRLGQDGIGKGRVPLADLAGNWLTNQLDRILPLARRIASLDETRRHRLRIEVKRLRYALDLFAGDYVLEAVAAYGDALAALQGKLGTMTDDAVAAAMLRTWAPGSTFDGLARRFDDRRTAKLRQQLPKVGALAVALELTPRPWRMDSNVAGTSDPRLPRAPTRPGP